MPGRAAPGSGTRLYLPRPGRLYSGFRPGRLLVDAVLLGRFDHGADVLRLGLVDDAARRQDETAARGADIDEILARSELKRHTPHSIIDKAVYKEEILEVRKQGIAYDREDYREGMVAVARPIQVNGKDLQAAIWAVGLTHQVPEASISEFTGFLKGITKEINYRFQ